MKPVKSIALVVVGVLFFLSCAKVPITGRRQLHLLPESQLMAMSLTEYRGFLSKSTLSSKQAETQMVKTIGQNIANAVTIYMNGHNYSKRIKGYNWEFNLVEDNNVNAWCMPGGKVVVYTGILPVTQNENALAVVMGHEIAHAIARHGNERMSQQLAVQFGGIGLDVAMSQKPEQTRAIFQQVYGAGATVGLLLPYSRLNETEADKMGLVFMAMAGYDPNEAIGFWKRMASLGGQKPPAFLSTHPSDEKRVKDLTAYMPTAMKYYKKR